MMPSWGALCNKRCGTTDVAKPRTELFGVTAGWAISQILPRCSTRPAPPATSRKRQSQPLPDQRSLRSAARARPTCSNAPAPAVSSTAAWAAGARFRPSRPERSERIRSARELTSSIYSKVHNGGKAMDSEDWSVGCLSFLVAMIGVGVLTHTVPAFAFLGTAHPVRFFMTVVILSLVLACVIARLQYGPTRPAPPLSPPSPPPPAPTAQFATCKGCFCSTPNTRIFRCPSCARFFCDVCRATTPCGPTCSDSRPPVWLGRIR